MFSASLNVGSMSQGGPDMRRRTLGIAVNAADPTRPTRRSPTLFDELADLYELDGAVVHRVLAYRNAAKAVREAPRSVARAHARGHA